MLQGFSIPAPKICQFSYKSKYYDNNERTKRLFQNYQDNLNFFRDACVTIVELERRGAMIFRVFRCYKTNFIDISNRM